MKTILFFNIFFLTSITLGIQAQEKEDNNGFESYSSSVFNSKENALIIVSEINKSDIKQETIKQAASGVIIEQIGNYNHTFTNLNTIEKDVSVAQNGNFNELSLIKEAKSVSQNIFQQGDNNTIYDYSYLTNYDIKTEIIQKGNNLNIQSYGTNSISKDMKITQTGNGTSLIILNKLN